MDWKTLIEEKLVTSFSPLIAAEDENGKKTVIIPKRDKITQKRG